MKKTTKKSSKKKSKSLFAGKKKQNNNNIKIAFYIVFIIVVLFVLYFINFKKPRQSTTTNENAVISEIFNPGSSNVIALPNSFKVYKQSDADTSGPACIMAVLSYFGHDEIFTLDLITNMKSKHDAFHRGTCVNQIKEILTTLKIKYWTDENYKEIPSLSNEKVGVSLIEKAVGDGHPVIVGWNKNPGQWSLVVGYDNKSTGSVEDDEIIMVNTDPKSNADAYNRVTAKEFESKWTFDNVFSKEPSAQEKNSKCFIIVEKN